MSDKIVITAQPCIFLPIYHGKEGDDAMAGTLSDCNITLNRGNVNTF